MRAPRWRCADPTCPKHRWQYVDAVGEYDDVDVALGELEAHHEREHSNDKEEPDAQRGVPANAKASS